VQAIIDNPSITPEQLHEEWLKQKVKDGWVFGVKKDQINKIHPCMLPYDRLPSNDRTKDAIFGATVRAVLKIREGRSC
jgi:hypothetical protein